MRASDDGETVYGAFIARNGIPYDELYVSRFAAGTWHDPVLMANVETASEFFGGHAAVDITPDGAHAAVVRASGTSANDPCPSGVLMWVFDATAGGGWHAPVQVATPTPAPSGAVLAATVSSDSTWAGGFCRSFTVRNAGTAASSNWTLRFTLPSTATITDSWSGTAVRSGTSVAVTPADWSKVVQPGASTASYGFCASGTGEPSAISVGQVD